MKMRVLSKDFNFAIAPKQIPIDNIICNVDSAIHEIIKQLKSVENIPRQL